MSLTNQLLAQGSAAGELKLAGAFIGGGLALAVAPSARRSVTVWPARPRFRRCPPAGGPRPAEHDHVPDHRSGRGMYFINLAFMALFVFVLGAQ